MGTMSVHGRVEEGGGVTLSDFGNSAVRRLSGDTTLASESRYQMRGSETAF